MRDALDAAAVAANPNNGPLRILFEIDQLSKVSAKTEMESRRSRLFERARREDPRIYRLMKVDQVKKAKEKQTMEEAHERFEKLAREEDERNRELERRMALWQPRKMPSAAPWSPPGVPTYRAFVPPPNSFAHPPFVPIIPGWPPKPVLAVGAAHLTTSS
jgi:hypothetical protein